MAGSNSASVSDFDTRDRSKWRRRLHLESAARLLTLKPGFGQPHFDKFEDIDVLM